MLNKNPFDDDTGDFRDGDEGNGEPGSGGDALLLRDIGGLEEHNFSLEQAGIFVSVLDFLQDRLRV